MAVVTLNPLIRSVCGRDGHVVWYERRGTQCLRAFVMPLNLDSALQKQNRGLFRRAVLSWQGLTAAEKIEFARQAKRRRPELLRRMSAYNIYISEFLSKAEKGRARRALSNSGSRHSAGYWGLLTIKYAPCHCRFPSVSPSHMLRFGLYSGLKSIENST